MTIDERIEKLTERHEALAQSVELLTQDVAVVTKMVDKLGVEGAAQQVLLNSVLAAMKELIEIVTQHERRIGSLERSA